MAVSNFVKCCIVMASVGDGLKMNHNRQPNEQRATWQLSMQHSDINPNAFVYLERDAPVCDKENRLPGNRCRLPGNCPNVNLGHLKKGRILQVIKPACTRPGWWWCSVADNDQDERDYLVWGEDIATIGKMGLCKQAYRERARSNLQLAQTCQTIARNLTHYQEKWRQLEDQKQVNAMPPLNSKDWEVINQW